jgi:hypothetical protein
MTTFDGSMPTFTVDPAQPAAATTQMDSTCVRIGTENNFCSSINKESDERQSRKVLLYLLFCILSIAAVCPDQTDATG